ncbi:MAG: ABC transporter substrate-binding protein [Oscillospiraceae bacterium]|nr:ABC transporter substrate-binding protein [Oscillospiraceae bacterium]
MKKILCFLLAAVLLTCVCLAMTSCGREKKMEELRDELEGKLEGDYTNDLENKTLRVYNWGEYISDGSDDSLDLNLAFEAITGIHVVYETYDSNETMYATLAGGGVSYDIIIPSDYMIARLIAEDRLQPIDFSKLSNFHYIDKQYLNPGYDPTGKYSVPYAGGYLGVIYNNTMVDEADVDGTWSLLWNDKYKGQILGIDNARDALGIAMYSLELDVNSTNTADWDKAAEKLAKQVPLLQNWVMDEIFDKMESENAAIATYYAGDYLTMKAAMEDTGTADHLSFYLPKEGTNIYFDAMCVCKDAPNYEAAMLYLNFMLEPYIALQNAEYIRYTCPNTAVVNNDEYSLKGNEFLYPTTEVKSSYYQHLDTATVRYYEQLWNKIKGNG